MFRSYDHEDGHKTETCSGYWIKYSNQCRVRRKPWTWPSTRNRIRLYIEAGSSSKVITEVWKKRVSAILIFCLEDGSRMFLQKRIYRLLDYTMSRLRRQHSSCIAKFLFRLGDDTHRTSLFTPYVVFMQNDVILSEQH
jgi:hypothetical protein